jgi:hypothetical protein
VEAQESAVTLSEPKPELAARLLAAVGFEQRLVGLKMAAMGGSNPSELYSLNEVANFIHVDDYETALRDQHATVGYVDPSALSRWVAEVLGDEELAAAITECAPQGAFYGSVAMSLKELLLERLAQCQAVLNPVEADPAS